VLKTGGKMTVVGGGLVALNGRGPSRGTRMDLILGINLESGTLFSTEHNAIPLCARGSAWELTRSRLQ
jgi:hypothetical protein